MPRFHVSLCCRHPKLPWCLYASRSLVPPLAFEHSPRMYDGAPTPGGTVTK